MYFRAPLVRFCLLYQLRGDLKKCYVKSYVNKEHCEIPKHIQVYFLLKFVEQDNGKTSDLEKDDFQLHSTPV